MDADNRVPHTGRGAVMALHLASGAMGAAAGLRADPARGPVALVADASATLSGRYFDERKQKPLPPHLLLTDLQDRVWAAGLKLGAADGSP